MTDVDPTGQFIYDTMFTRGGTAMYEGPYWRDDAVTGEAAIHEHKHAILIEREMSYMPLIIARLHKPIQTGFDFDQEPA